MFYPPKPKTVNRRISIVRRFWMGLRSSISVYSDRSYSTKMGEIRGLKGRSYFLVQPDLARKLLTSSPSLHPKGDLAERAIDAMVGKGLFTSTGDTWARRRKMVDSAFVTANISRAFPDMLAATTELSNEMPLGVLRIDYLTNKVAADIIFKTIFSRSLEQDEANQFFEAVKSFQVSAFAHGNWCMVGLPVWLSPFKKSTERPARVLREALSRHIDARLDGSEESLSSEGDLLDALISVRDTEGVGFTREELLDEVAVLFLAGHETSASSLAWALYLIANSPEIQCRLHEQIDSVLEGGELERSHLRKLPLVRDVFRETLRLYSPVTFAVRRTTQAERWRDKLVKPGSTIFVSFWLMHRHTEIWKDPDGFDPDRFSTSEGKKASREAYLPFSIGPRVCVGASFAMQEAAVVLSVLLQKYQFLPTGHVPKPVSKLTMRSENGIVLSVRPRTKPKCSIKLEN